MKDEQMCADGIGHVGINDVPKTEENNHDCIEGQDMTNTPEYQVREIESHEATSGCQTDTLVRRMRFLETHL